ncbi:MAG: bifunctional hydroxymethylpyrimidine kinase/phosphomethylpyrimidine kinase [Chloroflexi bacterium RBG_16_68_14]|nr:MAG: bifunctional hydroxymethylpyrimidine kinase/phosphomethylpyrimidine kinase [Chloroflexi bacterium RBG_16_68_14]
MSRRVPTVLTIAGSDSGGGAGVQADLKTFSALGVYGTSALTAVTAQNTQQVTQVLELPPELVAAQIDAVVSDIGADAVKTGMLATAEIVEVVAAKVREHGLRPLVVDPVMVAKSGARLLREDAVRALRERLLPLATVLTPNLPEAEVLLGRPLTSWDDVREAAEEIVSMGAQAVVMKGGHLPAGAGREGPATDLFYDGQGFHEFTAARVETTSTHGTGCTFASAIAAALAKGESPRGAVALAKAYVTKALQSAYPVGQGRGPVHHFFRFWQPTIGIKNEEQGTGN